MVRLGKVIRMHGFAVLAGAALLSEGWMAADRWRAARRAEESLAQRKSELQRLAAAESGGLETELIRAEAALARLKAAQPGDGTAAGSVAPEPSPATASEAFFELADFTARMRQRAQAAGVELENGERFGFSVHAHAGPAPEIIAAVQRQRLHAGRLLDALFASHPRRLLAVRRERPDPARPAEGEDFFALTPALSVREAGLVETDAFRLEFVGRTACLRDFLGRLAEAGPSALVRGIEVEPAREERGKQPAKTAGAADAARLLVEPGWSKFAVTVEIPRAGPPAEAEESAIETPAARETAGRTWLKPPAQSSGPEWVYDLFTPPAIRVETRTRRLTAHAPEADRPPGPATEGEFELELLAVRPAGFRLQLIGCLGGEADLRGVFVCRQTGETLLGRAGTRFPGLGLSIKSISLKPAVLDGGDGACVREQITAALVEDELADEEVELTTRNPILGAEPLGLFASRRMPVLRRELKAGETMELDGAVYRVARISLDPPQAVVARSAPGEDEAVVRTLPPRQEPGMQAAIAVSDGSGPAFSGIQR